jgi:hypothetical protein
MTLVGTIAADGSKLPSALIATGAATVGFDDVVILSATEMEFESDESPSRGGQSKPITRVQTFTD